MDTLEAKFVELYGTIVGREGANIKFVCPDCGHKALSCHLVKGFRHCFHCGYGKGMASLVGKPSAVAQPTVNRTLQMAVINKIIDITEISDSHKEYLRKRGIYDPEIYKLRTLPYFLDQKLKEFFTEDELVDSGFFSRNERGEAIMAMALRSRRLFIPHWHGDTYISCKTRLRPYVSEEDAKELRYASPRESQVGRHLWYKGLLRRDAIVTEGELCAMACNQNGITACGVPGLQGATNPEIIRQIKDLIKRSNTKRIFIIFDTDPKIRTDKDKIKRALTLRDALGSESCILYLPQDKPDECMAALRKLPYTEFNEIAREFEWTNEKITQYNKKKSIIIYTNQRPGVSCDSGFKHARCSGKVRIEN